MAKRSLLGNIKIVYTDDPIITSSGLGPMVEAFHKSPLAKGFYSGLPKRSSARSLGKRRLGLIFLSSLLYGHDAVDDLEEFEGDVFLENFYRGDLPAPRTMVDFLNDFSEKNINDLNSHLTTMGHSIRKQLEMKLPEEYKKGSLQLSIDSTSHIQHGRKMEGLGPNYKNEICLDSQRISDQYGLTYGFQLRGGSTGKGVGAADLINQAFSATKFKDEKFLSGDSAYLSQNVIKACMANGAFFTITATDTIKWTKRIEAQDLPPLKWEPWIYSEDEKKEALKKGKTLPKIELSTYHWKPSWDKNKHLHFPVVIKRTWVPYKDQVKKQQTGNLFDYADNVDGQWKHYAVVTSMPLIRFSLQEVIERHNKRGNCERFIKEEKYGFDLLHFPCIKLQKNYAYGLIAQVAHNILRWLAVLERPHKPHFSKKLRRRFIYIPGKLVKHARQMTLRIPKKFKQEVEQLREVLQWLPESALATGVP